MIGLCVHKYHEFKMNTEMKNNYYEILEIPQNATQHDITIAYEKAKRTYSSQNPAINTIFSEEETKLFRQMIDEAFTILGNQTYRNIYEKRLLAKNYSVSDLTVEAIKDASLELFPEFQKKEPQDAPKYEVNQKYEQEIFEKKDWLGDDLKQVREYKKITLESLHEKTKINPWYLTAVEKMDVANLPAPVFVRGYVIQIARVLGLKDQIVAESYMKVFRKKIEN